MMKVGITGGIGAGKTTVSQIFQIYRIPIYNSDDRAKVLMNTDAKLIREIQINFGTHSYEEGLLNRKYLANRVFQDKEKLTLLNNLVHPVVAKDFKQWLRGQQNCPFILKESALLFETGMNETLDLNISVSAEKESRIRRVLLRDQISRSQVLDRMRHQWSQEKKDLKADYIIYNCDHLFLTKQVTSAYRFIMSKI